MLVSRVSSLSNNIFKTKNILKTDDDVYHKNLVSFQAAPVKPKKKFLEKLADLIDEVFPSDPPKTQEEIKKQFNDDIDDIIRLS